MADVAPSEELRAFMFRLYAAWESQDLDAMREMFSARSHVLVIGTDPKEWWIGSGAIELWLHQIPEIGPVVVKPRDTMAFSTDKVGWIADRPLVTFANGVAQPLRSTMILEIERGYWRVVHWHVSIGQANEEALNLSLTTSIDKIERDVRVERPDVRPASAPDGTVTILFTDIESSTLLMERLGDTEFLRLLNWHNGVIRSAAEAHRGFVVKSQGDGFMLAFPSAAFALRASLVMRDRIGAGFEGQPVRIRAGLHAGEAIKHDDDFYGRTVVIAARISALATGGEILASELVHALAKGLGTFNFGTERRTTLKGLVGTFVLHPLIG